MEEKIRKERENMSTFQFVIELIGTIAFAGSGAMVAIRKRLDLLGVLILGVTTAVGGGMIRDLVIGIHPPVMFQDPVYVSVAIVTSFILFTLLKIYRPIMSFMESELYDNILNFMDAIGLGVFTVVGVNTAIHKGRGEYLFLAIFLGVITGVGGGVLRDIMVRQVPAILWKHIYACASIAGAVSYIILRKIMGDDIAMVFSTCIVVVIRLLARHYKWNLPRIS